MFRLTSRGSIASTRRYLTRLQQLKMHQILEKYGPMGVRALQQATPRESGRTAASWEYKIDEANGTTRLIWLNTHMEDGVNIAAILQYGHGTGTGGYIPGRDYINPALRPVVAAINNEMRRVVGQR